MNINPFRLGIGISLIISSLILLLSLPHHFSIDTTALASWMMFCFGVLIIALAFENKPNTKGEEEECSQ